MKTVPFEAPLIGEAEVTSRYTATLDFYTADNPCLEPIMESLARTAGIDKIVTSIVIGNGSIRGHDGAREVSGDPFMVATAGRFWLSLHHEQRLRVITFEEVEVLFKSGERLGKRKPSELLAAYVRQLSRLKRDLKPSMKSRR
jgi:hypothetical protein